MNDSSSLDEALDLLLQNPEALEAKGLALVEKPASSAGGDGETLSLTERQMKALRGKNEQLQNQIDEMIEAGRDNEALSEKMHRLSLALFLCESLPMTLDVIEHSLSQDFEIPAIAMRVWADPLDEQDGGLPEFARAHNSVRQYADLLSEPYSGRECSKAIRGWFDKDAEVQSFALLPLRKRQTFGLIAMASPDETRFHSSMGAMFLTRLSELASLSISRFVDA